MPAIDVQLDVQPVVAQQHAVRLLGTPPVSGELRRIRELRLRAAGEDGHEPDADTSGLVTPSGFVIVAIASAGLAQGVGGDGGVGALRERDRLVEKIIRPRDHVPRAHRVDSAGSGA